MRTVIVFILVLTVLLILAEIGIHLTGFGKEGQFVYVYVFCTVISIVITCINNAFRHHKNVELLEAERKLVAERNETIRLENLRNKIPNAGRGYY